MKILWVFVVSKNRHQWTFSWVLWSSVPWLAAPFENLENIIKFHPCCCFYRYFQLVWSEQYFNRRLSFCVWWSGAQVQKRNRVSRTQPGSKPAAIQRFSKPCGTWSKEHEEQLTVKCLHALLTDRPTTPMQRNQTEADRFSDVRQLTSHSCHYCTAAHTLFTQFKMYSKRFIVKKCIFMDSIQSYLLFPFMDE